MTRPTKLTDLQRVLLCTAAGRDDRSLLPLVDSIADQGERVVKAIPQLLKRGLVEEVDTGVAVAWRQDGDRHVGVLITDAGQAAIGAGLPTSPEPAGEPAAPPPAPERQTKAAIVLALLRREEGATLDELVAATGWLPHTTRAALTSLRKKGHVLDKSKRGEATCYRIAEAA